MYPAVLGWSLALKWKADVAQGELKFLKVQLLTAILCCRSFDTSEVDQDYKPHSLALIFVEDKETTISSEKDSRVAVQEDQDKVG